MPACSGKPTARRSPRRAAVPGTPTAIISCRDLATLANTACTAPASAIAPRLPRADAAMLAMTIILGLATAARTAVFTIVGGIMYMPASAGVAPYRITVHTVLDPDPACVKRLASRECAPRERRAVTEAIRRAPIACICQTSNPKVSRS